MCKITGKLSFSGDKSLSHRAAIFSAMAKGKSILNNYLFAEDTLNTLRVFESLGVQVNIDEKNNVIEVISNGISNWKQSMQVLDVGNSGTAARLLMGLFSGLKNKSFIIDGDESLQKRPMARIIKPLESWGAKFHLIGQCAIPNQEQEMKLPIQVFGQEIHPQEFTEHLGSAQVKSALMLAALSSNQELTLIEEKPSRDHTENMLQFLGVDIKKEKIIFNNKNACKIYLKPLSKSLADGFLPATKYNIWGDISSSAFFVVAASLLKKSNLVIENILLNEYRDKFVSVLQKMGANIQIEVKEKECGEQGGNLIIESSPLKGLEIPQEYITGLIDELPILTIAGVFSEGVFSYRNASELRKKETDRISVMVENLRNVGVDVEEFDDGLSLVGDPNRVLKGKVNSHMDHRIAMSFEIANLISKQNAKNRFIEEAIVTSTPDGGGSNNSFLDKKPLIEIEGKEWIKTSFPDFYEKLESVLNE